MPVSQGQTKVAVSPEAAPKAVETQAEQAEQEAVEESVEESAPKAVEPQAEQAEQKAVEETAMPLAEGTSQPSQPEETLSRDQQQDQGTQEKEEKPRRKNLITSWESGTKPAAEKKPSALTGQTAGPAPKKRRRCVCIESGLPTGATVGLPDPPICLCAGVRACVCVQHKACARQG